MKLLGEKVYIEKSNTEDISLIDKIVKVSQYSSFSTLQQSLKGIFIGSNDISFEFICQDCGGSIGHRATDEADHYNTNICSACSGRGTKITSHSYNTELIELLIELKFFTQSTKEETDEEFSLDCYRYKRKYYKLNFTNIKNQFKCEETRPQTTLLGTDRTIVKELKIKESLYQQVIAKIEKQKTETFPSIERPYFDSSISKRMARYDMGRLTKSLKQQKKEDDDTYSIEKALDTIKRVKRSYRLKKDEPFVIPIIPVDPIFCCEQQ